MLAIIKVKSRSSNALKKLPRIPNHVSFLRFLQEVLDYAAPTSDQFERQL